MTLKTVSWIGLFVLSIGCHVSAAGVAPAASKVESPAGLLTASSVDGGGQAVHIAASASAGEMTAKLGVAVRGAGSAAGETALTTLNEQGDVVVFTDRDRHGAWSGVVLNKALGGPRPTDLGDIWFDPKDDLLYVAVPCETELSLYKRLADGRWTVTSLTALLGAERRSPVEPI